nr:DUF817 family protein [Methyloceanibacter sp.]
RVFRYRLSMPLLVGLVLVALFIWFAENLSTFSRAWIYPNQSDGWRPVSIAKLGSWLLLMVISFVMVTFIRRPVRASDGEPADGALNEDALNEKGPQTRGP